MDKIRFITFKILVTLLLTLLSNSCSKENKYAWASYRFVFGESDTRCEFIDGVSYWKENDVINLELGIYDPKTGEYVEGEPGPILLPSSTVSVRFVYNSGSWITYVLKGNTYEKTDIVSVQAPAQNYEETYAQFRYTHDCSQCSPLWYRRIPFIKGEQTVIVDLPF